MKSLSLHYLIYANSAELDQLMDGTTSFPFQATVTVISKTITDIADGETLSTYTAKSLVLNQNRIGSDTSCAHSDTST